MVESTCCSTELPSHCLWEKGEGKCPVAAGGKRILGAGSSNLRGVASPAESRRRLRALGAASEPPLPLSAGGGLGSAGTASTDARYRSVSLENEQMGGCEPLPVPPTPAMPLRHSLVAGDRKRPRPPPPPFPLPCTRQSPVQLVEIPKCKQGKLAQARDTLNWLELETLYMRRMESCAFSTVKQIC